MTFKTDEARPKAPRAWRFGSPPSARGVLAAVLFAGVFFVGVFYSNFKKRQTLPRHPAQFPAPAKINEEVAAAEAHLKENPQDIAGLAKLGILHFEKGKEFYIDAINELEEARDLGALDSRIFYCLGIMYQETGLYAFAMEEYKRFLRNHPEDKEVRMLLAKLLYQQKRFPEAVEQYERLKFYFPKDGMIEENLGLSLWGAKSTERAIESFNHLKTFGSEQARRAELYLGQVDYDAGQYKAALEHLLLSLPKEGEQAVGLPLERVQAALAMTYQKLNKPEEAKQAWEKVMSLVPGDAKAQTALKELNRRFPPKKQKQTAKK